MYWNKWSTFLDHLSDEKSLFVVVNMLSVIEYKVHSFRFLDKRWCYQVASSYSKDKIRTTPFSQKLFQFWDSRLFPSPCRWWKFAANLKLELLLTEWSLSYIIFDLKTYLYHCFGKLVKKVPKLPIVVILIFKSHMISYVILVTKAPSGKPLSHRKLPFTISHLFPNFKGLTKILAQL